MAIRGDHGGARGITAQSMCVDPGYLSEPRMGIDIHMLCNENRGVSGRWS